MEIKDLRTDLSMVLLWLFSFPLFVLNPRIAISLLGRRPFVILFFLPFFFFLLIFLIVFLVSVATTGSACTACSFREIK